MVAKVLVAMSGGVDSAVAAALLKEEGYEVLGVTMNVWPKEEWEEALVREDACCALGAVEDARSVAQHLGIPHYVFNFREVFAEKVIADFTQEYYRGRTPNPCIRCNRYIKFDALLKRALAIGANFIATGHYARLRQDASGRLTLSRALDRAKDQSYALYVLNQEQLAHSLMPLGEFTKEETREVARRFGLTVAEKPDSQELCFIPVKRYSSYLEREIEARPGPILDTMGCLLGHHRGIPFYTVGQRRGLGIARGRPLYVKEIDAQRDALILGEEEEIYASGLVAEDLNLVSLSELREPIRVTAKIRYNMKESPALVIPLGDDKIRVRFDQPQWAITPGQAVVFYDDDLLLGGATILARDEETQF